MESCYQQLDPHTACALPETDQHRHKISRRYHPGSSLLAPENEIVVLTHSQSGSAGSSEPSVLFNPILPIVHTSGHRKCETTVENITAPDSSVGKMLLSQPAVTSIELFSHYYRPETEGKMYKPLVQSLIHNPEGVRMQDVYDQLVNDVRARTYCTGAILFFMRQNAHYKSLEWEPLEDTRQLEALKARLKK